MTILITKFSGKKNMLVELPIWIIKHEKNLFLCISEPSAFYRHFVRPIPVPTKAIFGKIFLFLTTNLLVPYIPHIIRWILKQ